MQRQIVSFYEKYLARGTRALLPRSIRAALTGLLFRATHHPDLAFRHAKHLRALDRTEEAVQLYAAKGSHADVLEDSLFDASLTLGAPSHLYAEFGYRGLWIGGKVPVSDWIEIRVDNVAVRREKLRGKSSFRYIVGRDALALLPKHSKLEVVDSHGDVLGSWDVGMPTGKGGLNEVIRAAGPLEKKGALRADQQTLARRQQAYLELFQRVNEAFLTEFQRPIFVLYGTLLGQHRNGDFIPGDDDFDVGYVSEKTEFTQVRDEALELIERLVRLGFTISLNAEGKPFRIRDELSGPDVWLDNRPVFCPDDTHVWLHKQAKLSLPFDDFRTPETGVMQGNEILKPRNSEAFLAAYYGASWRVPDPSFSNATKGVDADTLRGLAKVNITFSQQRNLAQKLEAETVAGKFEPLALQKLYPVIQEE